MFVWFCFHTGYKIPGDIQLVDDNMQKAVITLPFSVLQNFPTASVSETNQSTFLNDITMNLDDSESEGTITKYLWICLGKCQS